MREVSRYRARMPQEAWAYGREPRERGRRRAAADDLLAGLGRYLARRSLDDLLLVSIGNGELIRSERTDRERLADWMTWAAKLLDARGGVARAPDGSEWWIGRRIEFR